MFFNAATIFLALGNHFIVSREYSYLFHFTSQVRLKSLRSEEEKLGLQEELHAQITALEK